MGFGIGKKKNAFHDLQLLKNESEFKKTLTLTQNANSMSVNVENVNFTVRVRFKMNLTVRVRVIWIVCDLRFLKKKKRFFYDSF